MAHMTSEVLIGHCGHIVKVFYEMRDCIPSSQIQLSISGDFSPIESAVLSVEEARMLIAALEQAVYTTSVKDLAY